MLKNLKLGIKMGMGFGLLVLLVIAIGGIAAFNMLQIKDNSLSLQDEYVPEVEVANDIERNALQVMYNMRGYSQTFDPLYWDQAQGFTEKLETYLENAESHAEKYSSLVKLAKNVQDARENLDEYEKLSIETKKVIDAINAERIVLDRNAAEYLQAAGAYLDSQKASFNNDVAGGATAAQLTERVEKIYLLNDAIDYANNARILTFKAIADFDYALIGNAIEELDKITVLAKDLNAITREQADIEQLKVIATTRGRYYQALQNTRDYFERLGNLNKQRGQAADKVLAAAQITAKAGVEQTKGIAQGAVVQVTRSISMITIGIAIAVVFAILIAVFLTLSIVRALQKGVVFAQAIALGDLNTKLDLYQKDEVGILADALREMQKSLQYKAEKIRQIANKDLSIEIEKASDKDGLGESLITMKNSLNDLLAQVNSAVDQVNSGAEQVSQASQDLSQGATEQASSLEEITSSTNEINSQSKQNAEYATEAHSIAKQATADAQSGNTQMSELSEIMERINASSDEINKVVKVIDDIAFQINLLALNANVEAARAGKYGKGFAVVADEVRNLAVKSAESVKETTQMVEETVNNIRKGTQSAESTAAQLGSIVSGSTKVADFLEEIAQASREQAQAIEQITEGLDQIDQATQANTASAEESASASEELASQAQQLRGMVAQFKLDESLVRGMQFVSASRGSSSGSAWKRPDEKIRQVSKVETGVKQVNPEEQISLDDDDFERF